MTLVRHERERESGYLRQASVTDARNQTINKFSLRSAVRAQYRWDVELSMGVQLKKKDPK
jgi:hypothetical protein